MSEHELTSNELTFYGNVDGKPVYIDRFDNIYDAAGHSLHRKADRRKEAVNHPQHYGGDTTYEAIKVIEAWGLGFSLGNAVKYICRSPHKGTELDDLKKARWYLDRYIQQLEKGRKQDEDLQGTEKGSSVAQRT